MRLDELPHEDGSGLEDLATVGISPIKILAEKTEEESLKHESDMNINLILLFAIVIQDRAQSAHDCLYRFVNESWKDKAGEV